MLNKYIEAREARNRITGVTRSSGPADPFVRGAAVLAAVLFAVAMVLCYQAIRAEELPKKILVRSSFNQIELRLQQLAAARESYVVCMADKTCGVKIAVFEDAIRQSKIVEPEGFTFDASTSRLRGSLRYSGQDIEIRPREIVVQLPKGVMSESHATCPPGQPLLAGFDGEGQAICRPIAKTLCEEGEYVKSVDPQTLDVSCAPIGRSIACADGEFLAGFEWQGEDRVVSTCKPRLNPFIAWKFSPTLKSGPALRDGGAQ